ncbi:MAG: DUF1353 domain-containing protein [Pseudomonadota bacterium]
MNGRRPSRYFTAALSFMLLAILSLELALADSPTRWGPETLRSLPEPSKPAHAPPRTEQGGHTSPEAWLDELAKGEMGVRGVGQYQRFADPWYIVLRPFTWEHTPKSGKKAYLPTVSVPKGFVTDFASIPRAFWTWLRPDGRYAQPAVLHDYLYWRQDVPRKVADLIFYEAMLDVGVDRTTAGLVYWAVRRDIAGLGGGPAWRENARKKRSGLRRRLRRFPDGDPTMTWDEWRRKPGVF